jgi:multidrug efflux pump subunit AcrA (membrane-fusion protein)
MNASVQFLANDAPKSEPGRPGVLVPTTAVRDRGGKKVVMLAFQGKALAREVRILEQRSSGYLVEGLNGGENVIVNPPTSLEDGKRIKIKGS